MTTAMADPRRAWLVTGMLFLFSAVNYFDKLVLGLSAVPIMKEWGLSPSEYGLVASSFFALYAVSGFCCGVFFVNRISPKWLLVVLVAIWSVAQVPILLTSSLWVLVACRVVLGIGEGPGTPSAYNACYTWFPSERRNLPTAVLLAGVSFGYLSGAPLLSYCIATYGWRSAFLVCGALGLAWIALWLVVGKDGPFTHGAATSVAGRAGVLERVPWRAFWLDRTMLGNVILALGAYWVAGLSISWVAPYLQLGLGYTPQTTGWLISVILGSNVVILLLLSWVSQHLLNRGASSRLSRGVLNAGCVGISGLALILAMQVDDAVLRVVLLTIGFQVPQITFVLGPAMVAEIAPPVQRGKALLMTYSIITVTAIIAPILTGQILQAAGPQNVLGGYVNAFEVTGGVLLVCGIAGLLLLNPEATLRRFAGLAGAETGLRRSVAAAE